MLEVLLNSSSIFCGDQVFGVHIAAKQKTQECELL